MRRQDITAPAMFATGLVFALMGSRVLSKGNALIGAPVLGGALAFVDLCVLRWLLVFSFLRYDDATLAGAARRVGGQDAERHVAGKRAQFGRCPWPKDGAVHNRWR